MSHRVTAREDGWIRTHDEMRELLKYTVIGATVCIERLRSRSESAAVMERAREVTLVLDAAPHHAVNQRDIYTLPCKAAPMQRRIRQLADDARAALAQRGTPDIVTTDGA